MSTESLKLTVYFGERDRQDGRLTSDALLDLHERHRVEAAILLRATEGFGIKHRLHTQRLLTLSEDLPLISVAVDQAGVIEPLAREAQQLVVGGGLVTLERTRLVTDLRAAVPVAAHAPDGTKLTLFVGRQERVADRPAHALAVEVLRRHGVAGATSLLGVDGLLHHQRRRARFLSRNVDVPVMVVSVGTSPAVGSALAELAEQLQEPLATVERVRICKRDGLFLAEPVHLPETDPGGLGVWQKLTVVAGESVRHGRHPLYVELIHRLRLAGAAGATALRGIWGYSGDHAPHGDAMLSVRRRVPVLVTIVDTPARIRSLWPIVDETTAEGGLVTSEMVPAFRAVGPGIASGGLRLATLDPGRSAG